MFDSSQYSQLASSGNIKSVSLSGDNISVVHKAFDPITGAESDCTDTLSVSEINSQISAWQSSIAALQSCVNSSQALLNAAGVA